MRQSEQVPRQYAVDTSSETEAAISLISSVGQVPTKFTFEAVKPNIFRTTFTSKTHPTPPHPSVVRPTRELSSLSCTTDADNKSFGISSGDIHATVSWSDAPVVAISLNGYELHKDLAHRSYALDSDGIAHYTWYRRDSLHVGLGEKAAPMNLSNRFFQIAATDSFGYDVYRTDPLYKHIPLVINVTPKGCIAMFSTSHSRGSWAVGSEIEGLWGHFKVYRQAYGGLEEYLIIGKTIREVVHSYAELAGFPLLVPRWALGYLGGGMKYGMLDSPRACDAHLEFVTRCKEHEIPCSGFQMSSGYTIAETEPKTRNVFTWNRHRFPDPRDFTRKMHAQGVRLIANIKPYVLENHPSYNSLKEGGALYTDSSSNSSAIARLWSAGGGESGEGGHIDFTSNEGYQWWYKGVQELRQTWGIDSMWNDNNEFCIPDDRWQLSLERETANATGDCSVGLWGRSLQTELMAKASAEALESVEPGVRPFVLTRSATAGTMRYAASSWSGDNITSWDGMKGANALSLNAGFSLLQCYGHDIGGFEGDQPSPELLLRWVQIGIYSPRFAINCFKTAPDNNLVGEVIEPWMYPEITPLIRAAIQRRYEMMPYLYSLTLESHMTAAPPQRWIGWDYETDPNVWFPELLTGETQYWLGQSLLIGGVYEPGKTSARMYLPKKAGTTSCHGESDLDGFVNVNAPYQHFSAGQWVEVESQWKDSIPVLAKIGGAIIVGLPVATASSSPLESREEFPSLVRDDYRGVEIFPPMGSSGNRKWANVWYEDDGLTSSDKISTFTLTYWCTEETVFVEFSKKEGGLYVPLWNELEVILPVGDERELCCTERQQSVGSVRTDLTGRRRWIIQTE